MITKAELITQLKKENPTMVLTANGETTELNADEYEKACNDWADMRLAQLELAESKKAEYFIKVSAYEKLGLSQEEIDALLPKKLYGFDE